MTDPPTSTPESAAAPTDAEHPHRYNAALANAIELKWQAKWDADDVYVTKNPGDEGFDKSKPKFFCMDMFPYPSGAGLHVGHPEGYTATDIVSRFKRLTGHNVLHPMGFDAFGLPAEQYAIQTGVHPAITTVRAMDTFRTQLKRFGFCIDWSREFATIDEDYYCWTQWIWLKAYHAWYDVDAKRARPIDELIDEFRSGSRVIQYDPNRPMGLVLPGMPDQTWTDWDSIPGPEQYAIVSTYRLTYLSVQTVNWCPKLGTALANEEVIDGKSERGGFPVHRKPLKQWMFRITSFADRLLAGLADLQWPESTRTMQTQWIGRSEGANIDFPIIDPPGSTGDLDAITTLQVFTTRPDTLFGATYMVLAPEHELVTQIINAPRPETDVDQLEAYVDEATHRTDVDRMAESKDKTGVFTGLYADNPATGQRIPIWIADYVLMGYGTGAIMAVPGQDQRDWDFAKAFELPIIRTVKPTMGFDGEAFLGDGPAINSGFLDGMQVTEAKAAMIDWLVEHTHGEGTIQFKLRDWLFSRQRYWGEPFPTVLDGEGRHHPVMESKLPVKLPPLEDFTPEESDEPRPLLGKAADWVNTTAGEAGVDPDVLPPDTPVTRETNTMPNWAGSCWYHLRYCAPGCEERFTSPEAEAYWMGEGGVDLYIGGAEHAVLHLLYARFWQMILFDLGEVSSPEPYRRLFHQGMITSFAYVRGDKSLVPMDEVEETEDGTTIETATGTPVTKTIAKMSKSLHNVINPDDVIAEYGADTFRLYEMYMGPLEASIPWNPRDIVGVYRFLQRAWRLVINEENGELALLVSPLDEVERALHRTLAKVASDIDRLAMNTAIASMIEFVNAATSAGGLSRDQLERFAICLAPFTPHIAEELWHKLGHSTTINDATWPAHDESMLHDDEIEIPVQILGKVRGRITIAADADPKAVEAAALNDEQIMGQLEGKTVRKVIVVPGKIVNIIAS